MDYTTLLVTALIVGAVNATKDVAEQAVKDGYTGLKKLIQSRYKSVDVAQLEKNPESSARQEIIEEELTAVNASQDSELIQKAAELLETAAQTLAKEDLQIIGVEVVEVEGGNLTIRRVTSTGQGILIKKSKLGDIEIGEVDAGPSPDKSSKKAGRQ